MTYKLPIYILLSCIILCILNLLSLLLTLFINPGFPDMSKNYFPLLEYNTLNQEVKHKLKYCSLCEILISKSRSTVVHCTHCNFCIEGYDHHCGVLGKCIGKKNIFFFYAYSALIVLDFIFIMVSSVYTASKN